MLCRREGPTTLRARHLLKVNAPDLSGRNRVTALRAERDKRRLDLLAVDFLLGDHRAG